MGLATRCGLGLESGRSGEDRHSREAEGLDAVRQRLQDEQGGAQTGGGSQEPSHPTAGEDRLDGACDGPSCIIGTLETWTGPDGGHTL